MRKLVSFLLTPIAIVAFANDANTQQPQPSSTIALGSLFKGDSVDLEDGAAEKLKEAARRVREARDTLAPGQCPKPKVTVTVAEGDPIFQPALAAAQRDILASLLGGDARNFVFETEVSGTNYKVQIDASVTDTVAPKIAVDPPSGTKVKMGQKLTIKVTATEPGSGWQSGIKRIQIEDIAAHSNLQLWTNTAPAPRPCANAGLSKSIEATERVPDRPVWRLRVTAFDYANNRATQTVEYPTGDWYGRIEWSFHQREDLSRRPNENRSETKFDGQADLTVNHDGRGNLTGTVIGSQKVDTLWWGYPHGSGEVCKGSAPSTPVRARVQGSITPGPNTISLQLSDVEAAISVSWSGGGPHLTCTPIPPIENGPTISGLVRGLRPVGDGTYKSEFHTTNPLFEAHWTMTLRPAAN